MAVFCRRGRLLLTETAPACYCVENKDCRVPGRKTGRIGKQVQDLCGTAAVTAGVRLALLLEKSRRHCGYTWEDEAGPVRPQPEDLPCNAYCRKGRGRGTDGPNGCRAKTRVRRFFKDTLFAGPFPYWFMERAFPFLARNHTEPTGGNL